MTTWEEILTIINRELGEETGKVFKRFNSGFPVEEQFEEALNVLSETIGPEKANKLLNEIKEE